MKVTPHTSPRVPLSVATLITIATSLSVQPAFADTISGTGWKGQGLNNNWSTSSSWDSNFPNTTNLGNNERNLFFGQGYKAAGGNGFTTSNNDLTNWAGYRITFQDSNSAGNGTDGSSANDTAFTITGNGFTLFDFGTNNFPRIENDSFLTQTFTLTSGQTITLSGGTNNKAEINAVNGNLDFSIGTKIDLVGTTQLQMFGGKTVTYNGIISSTGNSGANSVTINAGTTVVYGAVNTYTGDTFINDGTLQIASGGGIASGSGIRLGNTGGGDATLGFTSLTGNLTIGSLINSGFNTNGKIYTIDSQNTSNTNTIGGNIFLDNNLTIKQAAGGTLAITNATLDLKAQTLALISTATTGLINITGIIGNSFGSGQLVIGTNGTVGTGGTVTLSNANTYSGDTFIRNGTLAFTSAGSSANSAIRLGSTSGTSVDANLNLSTLVGGTTLSSVINAVTTSGTGNTTINSQNTSNTNTLSGHIALDRNLTITQAASGTLNITQVHTGADVTNVLGNDIKGFTETFTPVALGAINVSGTIYNSTGSGSVLMNGLGTLTLSGANTYTGTTTINSGTLLLGASSVLASTSAMTLNGGKLNTGGYDHSLGVASQTASSVIDLGSGASHLTFSSIGAWSGVLAVWNWTGTIWTGNGTDQLVFTTNSLSRNLGSVQFYSDSGTTPIGVGASFLSGGATGSGELVPVPEPGAVLAASLLGLGILRRETRRRRVE